MSFPIDKAKGLIVRDDMSLDRLVSDWSAQQNPAPEAGILLVKDGVVIHEGYWGGCNRAILARIASGTNNITGISLVQSSAPIGEAAPYLSEPEAWVDVSHSLGFPLGGLGTGYSAFGRYGFVKVNFSGRPVDNMKTGVWEYVQEPDKKSSFGFVLTEGETSHVLQSTPAAWKPDSTPFDRVSTFAYLPKGCAVFEKDGLGIIVSVQAFTPLIANDLAASTIPVQVFEVTVENSSNEPRLINLRLANSVDGKAEGNKVSFTEVNKGELAFGAVGGSADAQGVGVEMSLAPRDKQTARFVIAWYYPQIVDAKRYYTEAFANAAQVVELALKNAPEWSQRIDAWHGSLKVPAFLKRLWFSSLSSVMTSTIMTSDPMFYEIETPHPMLNTMDVSVYSNWVYMINWPELEKMDMNQHFKATELTGPDAGLVLHSLWSDKADYVEEPTFLVRLYRDHLWYNDPGWSKIGFERAVCAANRVYEQNSYQYLINSRHGNQSYDIWKMPGVSAYVNAPWIYGLYGLEKMAAALGEPTVHIGDESLSEIREKATASFDQLLWNPQTNSWNLFHTTPDASESLSTADCIFSDQLFGKWVLAIDPGAENVLQSEKVNAALQTIYQTNLVEDKAQGFRGWSNGMLPGRIADHKTGYHARVCWFGAQFNLASLLGLAGNESDSLDVMRSVESSLKNNHLAAGEWNQSINDKLEVLPLPEEPQKDTPRFAPYPRYKSCWEYLIRMVGLQMDEENLMIQPFRTVDFILDAVQLAGMKLTLKVESGWTCARVDGKEVALPIRINRTTKAAVVEFVK